MRSFKNVFMTLVLVLILCGITQDTKAQQATRNQEDLVSQQIIGSGIGDLMVDAIVNGRGLYDKPIPRYRANQCSFSLQIVRSIRKSKESIVVTIEMPNYSGPWFGFYPDECLLGNIKLSKEQCNGLENLVSIVFPSYKLHPYRLHHHSITK